jgi:hypothetical protein
MTLHHFGGSAQASSPVTVSPRLWKTPQPEQSEPRTILLGCPLRASCVRTLSDASLSSGPVQGEHDNGTPAILRLF